MKARQTIFDVALQKCGTAESAYDIATHNNISLTKDNIKVTVKDEFVGNKRIVEYYEINNIEPATGGIYEAEYEGYWIHKETGEKSFFYAVGELPPPSWRNFASVVKIPEGVTRLNKDCFHYCQSLTEISLSQTLRELGVSCFLSCKKLKSITFPEGLLKIGNSSFQECRNLTTISLPQNLEELGSNSFFLCSELRKIVFKNTAGVSIYMFSWDHYEKLQTLYINELRESLDISNSPLISKESILYIINNAIAQTSTKKIKLHATVYAKLNSSDIATAAKKGFKIIK